MSEEMNVEKTTGKAKQKKVMQGFRESCTLDTCSSRRTGWPGPGMGFPLLPGCIPGEIGFLGRFRCI